MFRFLRTTILSSRSRVAVATSLFDNLGFYPNALLSCKLFSVLSNKASFRPLKDDRINSFIVSYLVNSCGIPLETALDVASKVKFRTPRNPDSFLSLLQSQGFTKTQISNIVKQTPIFLFSNSDKVLLPKFEYLHAIGLSKLECARIIHSCPQLLCRSLKNHIIPFYEYLKSLLVEDEKVNKCLTRTTRAFLQDLQYNVVPNITLLRTSGVSEVWISYLVVNYPNSAFLKHSKFCSIINQVRDLGFDPLKRVFVEVVTVLSKMTPSTLERKYEAYGKYGLSKDQILLAFKKFPVCLMLSEENIFKTMDFFVHKMGLKPEDISTRPNMMGFSLEKRIIPRWSVVQGLYEKGLLKKELSINSILCPTEKIFLEKYVTKFPKNVTWLLHLYNGDVKTYDV